MFPRPKHTDSHQIQPRDLDVLRSLLESRLMTLRHVSALHFENRHEATKKRIQKLKASGYIKERPRKPWEAAVLHITRKGLEILNLHGVLTDYPPVSIEALVRRADIKDSTVAHERAVLDAKVVLHNALRNHDQLSLEEFTVWPLLYQFEAIPCGFERRQQTVKPDAFIRIRETTGANTSIHHSFFLEIDLSTENHETLVRKAACYLDYFKSGGFAEWSGAQRNQFKEFPFKVLFIVDSAERRNILAERMAAHDPPLLKPCIASVEDYQDDPLEPIWIRPEEYLKAMPSMPPQEKQRPRFAHFRRIGRDRLVEEKVPKIDILNAYRRAANN